MLKKLLSILLVLVLCMSCFSLAVYAADEEPTEPELLPYQNPSLSVDERVADLISRMSVAEKIGQTIQGELTYTMIPATTADGATTGNIISITGDAREALWANPSDLLTRKMWGSILNGGGQAPNTDPAVGGGGTYHYFAKNQETLQRLAANTPHGIPIIYGIDAVHGFNALLGATVFPHNSALGCIQNNPALMKAYGEVTAAEVRSTGISWTFSPCTANAQNMRWGRSHESQGQDVNHVAANMGPIVEGLQGDTAQNAWDKIAACAKHYALEGWAVNGSNSGDVIVQADYKTNPEYINSTLLPQFAAYKAAIDAGLETIMPSYSGVNGQRCTENKWLLQTMGRETLGFKGWYVTDWGAIGSCNGLEMYPVAQYPELDTDNAMRTNRKHIAAFNAGIDMWMCGSYGGTTQAQTAMEFGVANGYITMERLDQSVSRILKTKFEQGLFDDKRYPNTSLENVKDDPAHKAVARQAVRESIVLLKNENQAVNKLKTMSKIYVAGDCADNLALQSGAWTIAWNSIPAWWNTTRDPETGKRVYGTTILDGFKEVAPGIEFVHSTTGTDMPADAEAAIIVLGESIYAEGGGDRSAANMTRLSHSSGDNTNRTNCFNATVAAARERGIPVVFIGTTGRPLIWTDYINQVDAFIAAWWPGTEGAGVADVIFGNYDFTGRLCMDWPASAAGLDNAPVMNQRRDDLDLLYKVGDGMVLNAVPSIVSAPEEVIVSEEFTFSINLPTKYAGIKLVNEAGKAISIHGLSVLNGSNINLWDVTTVIGTAGLGRQITILARTLKGDYEDVGLKITLDVVKPATSNAAAVKSASFNVSSARVNEIFKLTVYGNVHTEKAVVYSESGGKIGLTLISKSAPSAGVNPTVKLEYEMKVGSAGANRMFTVAAGNRYGIINLDDPYMVSIKITK